MIKTNINGNFDLDEVKRITHRSSQYSDYYVISLTNDSRKLYCSMYHSFLTDDKKSKNVTELKTGDKIWIDIHAFTKDKSLIEPFKSKNKCTI